MEVVIKSEPVENFMEVHEDSTIAHPYISPKLECKLLNIPTNSVELDSSVNTAATVAGQLTQKRHKLSGASKRKLGRLMKGGESYESALRKVCTMVGKNAQDHMHRVSTTSRRPFKRISQGEKARKNKIISPYNDTSAGIRVAIIHSGYPEHQLDNDHLEKVQQSIMAAVEEIPDDGPQVRFHSSYFRHGWLAITCADEASRAWLLEAVKQLQPWEGAQLDAVIGEPGRHIVVAYINDDTGTRLTENSVLTRLRKMNHGLLTHEWRVLQCDQATPGHIWTFSLDYVSFKALEKLKFRPFFGFGQISFTPKEQSPNYSYSLQSNPGPPNADGKNGLNKCGVQSAPRAAIMTASMAEKLLIKTEVSDIPDKPDENTAS